jgi:hypothetical protein
LTHGGYSETAITERAEPVTHHLFELAPWLAEDPTYVIPVARFVRVKARSQLLSEAIAAKAADGGILKVGARILEAATSAERLAAKLGDDLGLSPLNKARLKSETAAGQLGEEAIARLAETGRASLARRNDLRVVEDYAEAIGRRKVELAERSDRSGLGQKPDQQSDRQPRNNDDQQPRNNDQSEPQRDV